MGREHRSRGGERHAEYVCRRKQGRKAGHKALDKRPTQRAAESGPQRTVQEANTEGRGTQTGNTQTRPHSEKSLSRLLLSVSSATAVPRDAPLASAPILYLLSFYKLHVIIHTRDSPAYPYTHSGCEQ